MKLGGVVTKQLLELETKIVQNEFRTNETFLNEIIADDFIEIGSSGVTYNKKQVIEFLIKGTDAEIIIKDFTTKQLGELFYLALFNTITTLPSGQKSIAKRSSIWKYENNNWQIIFHQGTKV